MRKFAKVSIVVSHEDNDEFSAPVVEMMSGVNSVQLSNFESALGMLPPGSEVSVVAKGTVANKSVHNISRIIRNSCVMVALDLSVVHEFSRVFDSPFCGNPNLSAIIFPSNLVAINPRAFADCVNLESVVVGHGKFKEWKQEFGDTKGWFATSENGTKEAVQNLQKSDDNPFRFTLPSSPYRNCELIKEE